MIGKIGDWNWEFGANILDALSAMKAKTIFSCQSCGFEFPKWQGRCFECGAWNSLVETVVSFRSNSKLAALKSQRSAQKAQGLDKVETEAVGRFSTGFSEFDRVLGGGIVPGSVTLLAGEPGVGKSTLLLQVAASTTTLYVSGEESVEQLKLRADRLDVDSSKILVLPETDVDVIGEMVKLLHGQIVERKELKTIQQFNNLTIQLLIIDSIQTLKTDDLTSAAGSVSQVQECARRLARVAKGISLPLILAGHVTKEGVIAGPKTLTHLVDTVLYLEGEHFSNFRILRGVKNRFGQTSEVGIFEMRDTGMIEVKNPSAEILSSRKEQVSGSVVTVVMEGQRPLLLEIQALTCPTAFGMPRRTVNGIDYNRLLMLLAVLQKRVGLSFTNQDVYVNVSGGFKSFEPAVDLAICLALASSLKNKVLPKDAVAIGEVGLLGEIKKVPRLEERIKEAKKLGFRKIVAHNTADSIKEVISTSIERIR